MFYMYNMYLQKVHKYAYKIIISLLMSPLPGHRPSLWITHKEIEPQPTTRALLVGGLFGLQDVWYILFFIHKILFGIFNFRLRY
jgi:hypothetical protein